MRESILNNKYKYTWCDHVEVVHIIDFILLNNDLCMWLQNMKIILHVQSFLDCVFTSPYVKLCMT